MTINQFIFNYNVRPADAIVVKKENFGILDHYVIYLGIDQLGEHKFIANYSEGIKFIAYWELVKFLQQYVPIRINRFIGDEDQRMFAVKRALARLNEKAYSLILNNCQHFSNWVQTGVPKSEQVEDLGKGLVLSGSLIGLAGVASKNDKMAGIGILLAALGLIAIEVSEQ